MVAGLTASVPAAKSDTQRVGQPADRAEVGPIGRHGNRRPRHVSRSAASDRRSPSTRSSRAMARWVAVRSPRSSARSGARSSSRRRSADRRVDMQEPVAAGRAPRRAARGRAGTPGRFAASPGPSPDRPRRRRRPSASAGASGWSHAAQDRGERVGAGPEQALDLVALGELEVGQPVGSAGYGCLQLGRERAQPGRRAGRVAARADDVAEQDDGVHRHRLIRQWISRQRLICTTVSRQRLTDGNALPRRDARSHDLGEPLRGPRACRSAAAGRARTCARRAGRRGGRRATG